VLKRCGLPGLAAAGAIVLLACGPKQAPEGSAKPGKEPKPVPTPTEAYTRAEGFFNDRKFGKAISAYEKVDTSRDAALRAQVHLRLADSYFGRKGALDLAEAQGRYQSFLNYFPLSDQAAYAQYQYARCLQLGINKPERDQGPTLKAIAEFDQVAALYPESSWVVEARLRLDELENHLSRDGLLKARYYYTRKGYLPASVRLRDILRSNPDFNGRDEVLYLLGASLRRLREIEEGDALLQQVIDEYPGSKWAGKAKDELGKTG
jgi:outer membrane protein assembly factor BamD